MLKMLVFLRASEGLSRTEFAARWLAFRVKQKDTNSVYPLAVRYAFNEVLEKTTPMSPSTHEWEDNWHGIDEFWFDEQEAFERACQDETYNPLSGGCEWVDIRSSQVVLAREAPNAGKGEVDFKCKSFVLIQKLPQLTQAEFYYHWTVIHPPIWTRVRKSTGLPPPPKSVKNYIEEKLNGGTVPLGFDGIAEAWHRDFEEMGRPFQTREHDLFVLPDSDRFRVKAIDILAIEHLIHGRL